MSSSDQITTCEGMPTDGRIVIVNWGGDDAAIYYTDSAGGVRERTYKEGVWDGGTSSDVIFTAKTTTPLTAMQWFDEPSPGENMVRF